MRDLKYGFLTTLLRAPSSYGRLLVGGYRPYTGGSQHAVTFEGLLLHVGLRGSAADVTIGSKELVDSNSKLENFSHVFIILSVHILPLPPGIQ